MRAIVQGMIGFLLTGLLLAVCLVMVPSNFFVAGLALWGASGATRLITIEFEELLAALMFNGALAGCIYVWFFAI